MFAICVNTKLNSFDSAENIDALLARKEMANVTYIPCLAAIGCLRLNSQVVSLAKRGDHISRLQGLSSSTSFTTMAILLFERRACNGGNLCDKKVATVPIEVVHTFDVELRYRRLSQAGYC